MRWFSDLRIFKKLMLAFGVVGLFVLCLGIFSLSRLSDLNTRLVDMNENWMPSIRDLMALRADLLEQRTYHFAAATTALTEAPSPERDAKLADFEKRAAATAERDRKARAHYITTITGPEERALWDEAARQLDAYNKTGEEVFKAAHAGDGKAALALVDGARELRRVAAEALQKDIDFNSSHADEVVTDSQAAYARNRLLLIGGTLAVVLLGLGLGFVIARAVSRPVGRASAAAQAIADGKLDNEVHAGSADEIGELLCAMAQMQTTIKSVVAAQAEMAAKHHAGEMSFRVPADRFPGTYGTMARQTNEMVAEHIAVSARVVEVVKSYAEGDFSVAMDALPGEKARITEAVEGVKSSFVAISSDIKNLVAAAGRGDFAARGDVDRYRFAFREMVQGLNDLMKTCDSSLSEIARVLGALARGDLTQTVDGEFQGTFAQLKDDTNETVTSLTAIVSEIRGATDLINTAAREIAAGNMDLSSRTEQQAASLEETAASMEELTSTVKQTADNAGLSRTQAAEAAEVANAGGAAVSRVVSTMEEISDSSRRIADIIGVIDGIAFQTNILALNAAVEAARAGEQGRGFAVVASEVRTLAQRSADAAKEIKGLITASNEKVAAGAKQVHEAGSTIQSMVTSVDKVRQLVTDISAAAVEQSSGIEQVNTAVTQMDQVTQQNAALVEEAAAAAKSMEEQAQTLAQAVARFRLNADGRNSPARAAVAAVAPVAALPKAAGTAAGAPRLESKPARNPAKAAAKPSPQPAARPAQKAKVAVPAGDHEDDWAEF